MISQKRAKQLASQAVLGRCVDILDHVDLDTFPECVNYLDMGKVRQEVTAIVCRLVRDAGRVRPAPVNP